MLLLACQVDHALFLQELQALFLIRVDPALVPQLMAIYDPAGTGVIDYQLFAANVMASATSIAGGAATSYGDRDRPAIDPQGKTALDRNWGFEEVEGCLRKQLQGDRGRRVVEGLNSCDMSRDGTVHASELQAVLRAEALDPTASQFTELLRNFPVDPQGRLCWTDFTAAFVSNIGAGEDDDGSGDPAWDGLSVQQVKALIRWRVEARIGAGPDQVRPPRPRRLSLVTVAAACPAQFLLPRSPRCPHRCTMPVGGAGLLTAVWCAPFSSAGRGSISLPARRQHSTWPPSAASWQST